MLFLIVIVSVPAAAQDEQFPIDTIEQLMSTEVTTVTGASKYQQELIDAPASISIISADDIRKGGYRTLDEILNSVRGFYTTYDRAYSYVGLRGFSPLGDYGTRLLVLVDGHRLNDAVYEQAPVGSDFPVDIDLIKRVEVIRGPSSSLRHQCLPGSYQRHYTQRQELQRWRTLHLRRQLQYLDRSYHWR